MDDSETQIRDVISCKRLLVAILYPDAYRTLVTLEQNPCEANEARFERELLKINRKTT